EVGRDELLVSGKLPVDELNERWRLDLPTEEASTVGGLIATALGRIPAQGDVVRIDGISAEVVSVAGRRIRQARVRRLPEERQEG
ncbi:MAG TPA: transporter associated domain-containing protein, partial [Dehalococcoidia bacterium]